MEKIIALLFLLVTPGFATPADTLFKEGNALYKDGKFAEAAERYQAQAKTGNSSWVLDYNLGNAFYRQGQLGRAVLHYERAFRANSSQKDVVYNLSLASAKAGDPRLPDSGLVVLAWKLYYGLTLNALTLLSSLLFFVMVGMVWGMLSGRLTVPSVIPGGLTVVFLVLGAWLGVRIYEAEHPKGVVITSIVEVRSGPSASYPANFTVPEGHRVLILDTQEPIQGWLQVGVPQEGLRGWVPNDAVSVI